MQFHDDTETPQNISIKKLMEVSKRRILRLGQAPMLPVGELDFYLHVKSPKLQLHELNAEVMQAC